MSLIVACAQQACAKCSARESIVNTVMFFVGVFAYTGVAIALMSYFDVGRSSNFEAWVNYDQVMTSTGSYDVCVCVCVCVCVRV